MIKLSKTKRGRPRTGKNLGKIFGFYLKADDKERLQKLAVRLNRSMSSTLAIAINLADKSHPAEVLTIEKQKVLLSVNKGNLITEEVFNVVCNGTSEKVTLEQYRHFMEDIVYGNNDNQVECSLEDAVKWLSRYK